MQTTARVVFSKHGAGLGSLAYLWAHRNTLAAQQSQQLVVIQQSVHALNPQGVHRAVKQDPFLVWALVLTDSAHDAGQNTILPLVGALIKGPIQLIVGKSQGVYYMHLHLHSAAQLNLTNSDKKSWSKAYPITADVCQLPEYIILHNV